MEFLPAYDSRKRTPYHSLRGKSGVYVIREKSSGLIVYIGMSICCVYRAAYRHFHSWATSKQYRVTYPKWGYCMCILEIHSEEVESVERALIHSLNPRDNIIRYESDDAVYCLTENDLFWLEHVEACPF